MLEVAADRFAACQMPINPVGAASDNSFIKNVLPKLVGSGYAVLAMKSLADCIRSALSMPIMVLMTAAENPVMLSEKTQLARGFAGLTERDRTVLVDKVLDHARAGRVEYYKS